MFKLFLQVFEASDPENQKFWNRVAIGLFIFTGVIALALAFTG